MVRTYVLIYPLLYAHLSTALLVLSLVYIDTLSPRLPRTVVVTWLAVWTVRPTYVPSREPPKPIESRDVSASLGGMLSGRSSTMYVLVYQLLYAHLSTALPVGPLMQIDTLSSPT